MLADRLNSPAWLLVFEALRHDPNPQRLSEIVALRPDVDELLTICKAHGVLLMVDRALGPVRRGLFDAEQFESWRREVAAFTLRNLTMHRELQRLLALFAGAQIPIVPLKGPTLSERLYGDPLLRIFSDLDLLVPTEKVIAAIALLEGEGYRTEFDPAWLDPGARDIHAKLWPADGGWLVELHWAITCTWQRRRAAPLRYDDWLRADTADHQELLLYLCMHASQHWWQSLKWVVDVDRCVRVAHRLDWERLFAIAAERRCVRILRLGLLLAQETCGLDLPADVTGKLRSDPAVASLARRMTHRWAGLPSSHPSFLWQARYFLACRDNLSDRVGMLMDYACMRWRDRMG